MSVDIPELFNQELPARLARHPNEVAAINTRLQVNVTGVGSWNADLTSSGPRISAGEGPADCTITVSGDDFQKILASPTLGPQFFFGGRVMISGDRLQAMKLQKLLSLK